MKQAESAEKDYLKRIEQAQKSHVQEQQSLQDELVALNQERRIELFGEDTGGFFNRLDLERQIQEKLQQARELSETGGIDEQEQAVQLALQANALKNQLEGVGKRKDILEQVIEITDNARNREAAAAEQAAQTEAANQEQIRGQIDSTKAALEGVKKQLDEIGKPKEVSIEAQTSQAESALAKLIAQRDELLAGGTLTISAGGTTGNGGSFSSGDIIDYTGPALVHGSQARPEFMLKADAVQRWGVPALRELNAGKMPQSFIRQADAISIGPVAGRALPVLMLQGAGGERVSLYTSSAEALRLKRILDRG